MALANIEHILDTCSSATYIIWHNPQKSSLLLPGSGKGEQVAHRCSTWVKSCFICIFHFNILPHTRGTATGQNQFQNMVTSLCYLWHTQCKTSMSSTNASSSLALGHREQYKWVDLAGIMAVQLQLNFPESNEKRN